MNHSSPFCKESRKNDNEELILLIVISANRDQNVFEAQSHAKEMIKINGD